MDGLGRRLYVLYDKSKKPFRMFLQKILLNRSAKGVEPYRRLMKKVICERWITEAHISSDNHVRNMQAWVQRGRPLLTVSQRFSDRERLEMLIRIRHPLWDTALVQRAKDQGVDPSARVVLGRLVGLFLTSLT